MNLRSICLFLSVILLAACGNNTTTRQPSVAQGNAQAESGKAIFRQNCSSCHLLNADAAGPALQGVLTRWDGDSMALRAYIRNPAKSIEEKERHALKAWQKFRPTVMTPFPNLSDEDLNALIAYFQSEG